MEFLSKSAASVTITAEGNARLIAFSAPGHLRVLASPQAVEGTRRSGADLMIHMTDGTVLVIRDYYLADTLPVIEFTGGNGTLWAFLPGEGGGPFVLRPLVTDAGFGAALGGTAGLATVIAGGAALGLGQLLSQDSGSGADTQLQPPVITPPVITPPVTEPPVVEPPVITPPGGTPGPLSPPDLLQVGPDGGNVSGTGTPGAEVIVRDSTGAVLAGGEVGSDGSFTLPLTPPVVSGEDLSVTLQDEDGRNSPAVVVPSPDLTPPEAPADLAISPDGAVLTGRGEAGSSVILRGADGTVLPGVTTWTGDSFTVTLTPPASRGDLLEVELRDAAGNTSDAASLPSPDLTPPEAPADLVLSLPGVVLTGQAEAGAVVEVRSGGLLLGSGTAEADGSFRITLSPAQANGQQLLVTATDAAGLTSAATPLTAADITPPGAAQEVAITADGTVVTGEGEPLARVIIRDDQGVQIGAGQVAGDGRFSVTLDAPQQAGGQLQVTLRDAADLVSPGTPLAAPDLRLPPAPEDLLVDPRSGASLSGTGLAGATVTVRHNGSEIGRTTVQPDGSFTASLTQPGLNREIFEVQQSFDATRVSPPASVTAPDLTAPDAAEALAIDPLSRLLSGEGEPLARVTVTGPNGIVGVGQIDSSGAFRLPLFGALLPNDVLSVTLRDEAGNSSAGETVPVPAGWLPADPGDTTAPLAATEVVIAPGTGASLSGKGEAGAIVVVYDAGDRPIASGLVTSDGDFTLALTPPLKNGEAVTVRLTDAAGNTSPQTPATAPDLTPPDAARALEVSITGSEVTGLGEPGTTATVYNAAGAPIGTATVGSNGRFTVTLNAPVLTGEDLAVRLTDGAGLTSPLAQAASPDRTAPDAPWDVTLSASGQLVTGSGEPRAMVDIRDSAGRLLGQGRVGADGTFSVQLSAVQLNGEHLNVVLRDAAGNLSDPALLTAADRTPPEAPEHLALSHDGLILTGRGEAGTTVTVTGPGGGSLGTATVAGNGSFTVNLTVTPPRGAELSVILRDGAGNASDPGEITRPVLPPQPQPLAQDNLVSLALDITPTRSPQVVEPKATSFSTANVGLGSLLAADVLTGKNSLQVEVAENTARVVTLRGDAGGVTLLSRFALSLYRFDEVQGQWLLDSRKGDFLNVSLLGGRSDDLTVTLDSPGRYAFSLTPVSGVSVLTGYSLYMTADVLLDYSRPLAASGGVSGNVLSDPDAASGLVDTLPAGTVLHSVEGRPLSGATSISGTHGTLTIQADGSYSYSVNPGFRGTPGASDSFTYELRHTTAAGTTVSQAELTITLDHTPVPPETLVVEVALDATPRITPVGSGHPAAIAPRSQVSLLELGLLNPILKAEALNEAQAMTFSVGENTLQSMTFQAEGGGLELGSQYALVVYKKAEIVLPDGTQGHQWVQYHLEEDWLTIVLLYGRADALPMTFSSGEYAVVMAGTGGLAVLGGMTLSVTDHSITDYQTPAAISGSVTGDLTTGDTAGWSVTSVNGQALSAQPQTGIRGSFGTLRVQADGSYSYTAFAQTDPAWKNPMGQADTFLLRTTDGGAVKLSTVTFSLDTLASGSQHAEMLVDLSNALGGPVTSVVSGSHGAAVLPGALELAKVFEVSGSLPQGARLTAEADALGIGVTGISAVLYRLTEVTAADSWTVREGPRYFTREAVQTLSSGSSNEVALNAALGELPPGFYQLTAAISKPPAAAVAWSLDLGLQGLVADAFDVTGTGPAPISGIAFDLTSPAFASTTQVKAAGGTLDLGSRTGPDLLTLNGEYGVLTLHKNGSWAYQASGSDFGVEDFRYTLVSPSGAEAPQSLSIAVGKNVTGSSAADVVEASEAGDRFTLGAGADVLRIELAGEVADIWTDFSLAEGDRLDLSALVGESDLAGSLQVHQEAGDSTLRLLDSGTGDYRDLIVLENTSVTLSDLLPGLAQSYP